MTEAATGFICYLTVIGVIGVIAVIRVPRTQIIAVLHAIRRMLPHLR